MKVHIRDMTGLVLDFAVATARKIVFDVEESDWYGFEIKRLFNTGDCIERTGCNPSKDKAEGMWVVNYLMSYHHVHIENKRAQVIVRCSRESIFDTPLHYVTYKGRDVVEASSRCFVAIKHGVHVNIPEHYVNHQIESDVNREICLQQLFDSRRKKKP